MLALKLKEHVSMVMFSIQLKSTTVRVMTYIDLIFLNIRYVSISKYILILKVHYVVLGNRSFHPFCPHPAYVVLPLLLFLCIHVFQLYWFYAIGKAPLTVIVYRNVWYRPHLICLQIYCMHYKSVSKITVSMFPIQTTENSIQASEWIAGGNCCSE